METVNYKASPAMRRYAAEIFRLQQDHEKVSLSDLAGHIDSSSQATSRMVKRLKDGKFLSHAPYRGVRLTTAGDKIAMPALRRHRLSEVFLVNIMGYDWATAHDLTDTFELGVNAQLEDRIDELTDFPTNCPHGEPIPTKEGLITFPDDVPMIEVGSKVTVRISRVRTHDLDKLTYIGELGLKPGVEVYISGCAPFKGPLRLQIKNSIDQVIGYELAKTLWVETIDG